MKPPAFDYAKPTSLDEALRLLAEAGDDAKIIAGGQSLVPLLNFRLAAPRLLIDINAIPGLDTITADKDGLRLGALVRWRQVEESAVIAMANPLLSEAVRHIAHYQIRNRGTVGGSCAHADPAAELPAICIACGAVFVLQRRGRRRSVGAEEFFAAALVTALDPAELLTEIRFPAWPNRRSAAFEEIAIRRGDFALIGAMALLDCDEAGLCTEARIVAFGLAEPPRRLTAAEAALVGTRMNAASVREAATLASQSVAAQSDLYAPAEYRRAMVEVLVERVLIRAGAAEPIH